MTKDKIGEGWNQPELESEEDLENDPTTDLIPRQPIPVGMARKSYVPFDEDRQNAFLKAFAETGRYKHACELSNVSYQAVRSMMNESKEFKELVEEAHMFYADNLEQEALRRAVDGYLEPVFSQKTGTQIGVVRKFSDRLLEILLKAHRPEKFRDNVQVDHKHSGGVLVVPAGNLSPEQWERQYGDQVAGPSNQLAGAGGEGGDS